MKLTYTVKSQIPKAKEIGDKKSTDTSSDTNNNINVDDYTRDKEENKREMASMANKIATTQKNINKTNRLIATVVVFIVLTLMGLVFAYINSVTQALNQLKNDRYELLQEKIEFIDQKYSKIALPSELVKQ